MSRRSAGRAGERIAGALGALAFPAACPGCGTPAEPVCDDCAARLAAAPDASPPAAVDAWAAAYAYEGVARELVARLKYRNARAATAWLAAAVAVAAAPLAPAGIVVTWVPTTPERRRGRGFDHAELLARSVARRLDRPAAGLLRRVPGPPQTGRPRAERQDGPRFLARTTIRVPEAVLLVDDVSTTGASLSAAAATLRSRGVRYVRAATVARTPDPTERQKLSR